MGEYLYIFYLHFTITSWVPVTIVLLSVLCSLSLCTAIENASVSTEKIDRLDKSI